jgi:hypothetical protein
MNWYALELLFLLGFWGGYVGSFFLVKSVFQPKNLLLIPTVYFMVFIPVIALVNLHASVFTLVVASAVMLKWSVTNTE